MILFFVCMMLLAVALISFGLYYDTHNERMWIETPMKKKTMTLTVDRKSRYDTNEGFGYGKEEFFGKVYYADGEYFKVRDTRKDKKHWDKLTGKVTVILETREGFSSILSKINGVK